MILVLNLNASVDKRYMLDDFVPGTIMRAPSVSNTAGGKGIHVARVASLLGEETLTTGFLGGKTGEFIEERLRRVGLPGDFVKVEGATRSCLAFLTRDGGQTEVLEPGPEISCEELAAFREKYTALLARADVVAARPDFIKPNQEELAALLGHPVETAEDALQAARTLSRRGVRLVCVSLGAAGSIACEADACYRVRVPKIDCKNPVGSGDSFVAGAATALARGEDTQSILRLAAACGTANALEAESGFVRPDAVRALLPQIEITPITI